MCTHLYTCTLVHRRSSYSNGGIWLGIFFIVESFLINDSSLFSFSCSFLPCLFSLTSIQNLKTSDRDLKIVKTLPSGYEFWSTIEEKLDCDRNKAIWKLFYAKLYSRCTRTVWKWSKLKFKVYSSYFRVRSSKFRVKSSRFKGEVSSLAFKTSD